MSLRTIVKVALISVVALILFAAIPALYFFLTYYHSLEQEVVTRFSQKHWNIPSRIYSDSHYYLPRADAEGPGLFRAAGAPQLSSCRGGQGDRAWRVQLRLQNWQAGYLSPQLRVSVSELPRRDSSDFDVSRNEVIQGMSHPGHAQAAVLDGAGAGTADRHLSRATGSSAAWCRSIRSCSSLLMRSSPPRIIASMTITASI